MTPGGHAHSSDGPVVAAVDCGTNSTRLLIARSTPEGGLETVRRIMHITRLGDRVDATGRLDAAAITRTTEVLGRYREEMERHGVEAVRASATSAARDAENAAEFFTAADRALGVTPELLSGAEEASLSFLGATASLDPSGGPFLVVDIGGGSTELAVGTRDTSGVAHLSGVCSLALGCVRMTERHLHHDPPSPAEVDAATTQAERLLCDALADLPGAGGARTSVGLAGTVAALASIDLGLASYDHDRIHHHVLTAPVVEQHTASLAAMTVAERRAVPGMEVERADVIVGGLVVLRAFVRATGGRDVCCSEADILDGMAASLIA